MSVRVTNTNSVTKNTYSVTNVTNGITTIDESSTYTTVALTDTRTGHPNLVWKAQVRKNQNATTVLSGTRTTCINQTGSYTRSYVMKKSPFSFIEDHAVEVLSATNPGNALLSPSAALSGATTAFYNNARNAQRSFNGGTFMGELGKTIGMIKNPAKSFRDGVSSFTSAVKKRTKGKGIMPDSPRNEKRQAGKIIAETYLEYAFGWRPLMMDVNDGAKAMSKILDKAQFEFSSVTGRGHEDGPSTVTWLDHASVHAGIWGRVHRSTKQTADAIVYGKVRIGEFPGLQGRITRQLGLTLSDVAPTAWELIPWSFLIDYFTNVGDIISAASFCKSDLAWAAQCVKRKNITTCAQLHKPHPAPSEDIIIVADYGSPSNSVRTYEDIQRSPIGTPPVPPFTLHMPFSNTQWTNIGALIAARQRRF